MSELDIYTIRRNNLLNAYQAFAEEQVLSGVPPKGLDQKFAQMLQISPTSLSSHKSGARHIGDKVAAQFEGALGHPPGWLSVEREPVGLTPAEQALMAAVLKAHRGTNAEGRQRLKKLIQDFH